MKIFNLSKKHLLEHKYSLILYVTVILSSASIGILSPFIIGSFLDNLIEGAEIIIIIHFAAIFGGLGLLRISINYASSMLYVKMQTQMAYGLNSYTISHIQSLSLTHTNNQDSAYLNNRINSDSNSIIAFCISIIQNVLMNAVMLVAPFVVLFSMNRVISLSMLVFLAVFVVSYTLFKKPLYKAGFELKESQSKFISSLFEQLKYIRTIKLNSIQQQMDGKVNNAFIDLRKKTLHNQKVSYLYSGMDGFISTFAQILLFVVGGIQIINGRFTIGMFTIFTSYFNMMLGASRYFFGLGAAYQNVLVAYDRMVGLLNLKPELQGERTLLSVSRISLQNLVFSYHGATNSDGGSTLAGISTNFTKGNMYALAGVNGTGKSTLAALIMGMYIDEYCGGIYYDGVDIRETDMVRAREKLLGFAEQEPVLLNESIGYNITFDASKGEAEMKKDARLSEYIKILNMQEYIQCRGYSYEINEINTNTSGGEKQKIAILRLLYKNPDVMIFDEPTSALDMEATKKFIEYLCQVKSEKIVLIITHDEYIMSCCDEVLEMTRS